MDERARGKAESVGSEVDAGAMLSLVPPSLWPRLALISGISPLGAAGQGESDTQARVLLELAERSAPDPARDQTLGVDGKGREQSGSAMADPEPPARLFPASSAAGGEPMKRAEPRANAQNHAPRQQADAWAKVTVQGNRGRLPAALRAVAEQMLIEGASPEEVVQAARNQGLRRLKRSTLQRWLDHNPDLRERSLRRQAETAEALRRSLAGDLGSPEARLAEAALFAGLSRPLKRSSRVGARGLAALERSMQAQLERENRSLRRRAERLQQRKRSITRRIIRARLRLEGMRWRLLQRHVSQLYSVIEAAGGGEALAPQLVEGLRSLGRLARGEGRKDPDPEAS